MSRILKTKQNKPQKKANKTNSNKQTKYKMTFKSLVFQMNKIEEYYKNFLPHKFPFNFYRFGYA